MAASLVARSYRIGGHVQGVGFRNFVQREASRLGVSGWVRNLDDGGVEVYAIGTAEQLADLAGLLHKGPRWADVREVEEKEAALQRHQGFRITW
jgi:acylphosphatase